MRSNSDAGSRAGLLENLEKQYFSLKERHRVIKKENEAIREHLQQVEERVKEMKEQSYASKYTTRPGTRLIVEQIKKDIGPVAKQATHFKEKLAHLQETREFSNNQADSSLSEISRTLVEMENTDTQVNLLSEALTNSKPASSIMALSMSLLGTALINENTPGLRSLQTKLLKIELHK